MDMIQNWYNNGVGVGILSLPYWMMMILDDWRRSRPIRITAVDQNEYPKENP